MNRLLTGFWVGLFALGTPSAIASSYYHPIDHSIRFVNDNDDNTYMSSVDPYCTRIAILADPANINALRGTLPTSRTAKQLDSDGQPKGDHTYHVSKVDLGTMLPINWGEKTRLIGRLREWRYWSDEIKVAHVKPADRAYMKKCLQGIKRIKVAKEVRNDRRREASMSFADQCEASGKVYTKDFVAGRIQELCMTQAQFDYRYNSPALRRVQPSASGETWQRGFDEVTDKLRRERIERDRSLQEINQQAEDDRNFYRRIDPYRNTIRCSGTANTSSYGYFGSSTDYEATCR